MVLVSRKDYVDTHVPKFLCNSLIYMENMQEL